MTRCQCKGISRISRTYSSTCLCNNNQECRALFVTTVHSTRVLLRTFGPCLLFCPFMPRNHVREDTGGRVVSPTTAHFFFLVACPLEAATIHLYSLFFFYSLFFYVLRTSFFSFYFTAVLQPLASSQATSLGFISLGTTAV